MYCFNVHKKIVCLKDDFKKESTAFLPLRTFEQSYRLTINTDTSKCSALLYRLWAVQSSEQQMRTSGENREGYRRYGEAAERPPPASSDPIITPCISQALWPLWRLQRICEWKRNPSRVMVLLYALRAAIFNPYPSCLSHKLCNHGPVCRQQAGPTQRACGLHALFKKESGVLLYICSLLSLLFYLNQMCQVPSFSSILSLSSAHTPLLLLAAIPSHLLPFSFSLPPFRYVFTLSPLSSCCILFARVLCVKS